MQRQETLREWAVLFVTRGECDIMSLMCTQIHCVSWSYILIPTCCAENIHSQSTVAAVMHSAGRAVNQMPDSALRHIVALEVLAPMESVARNMV